MRKKVFRGHANSGYACQIDFSPNGQFIISGDSQGKLNVWDWTTCKVFIALYTLAEPLLTRIKLSKNKIKNIVIIAKL